MKTRIERGWARNTIWTVMAVAMVSFVAACRAPARSSATTPLTPTQAATNTATSIAQPSASASAAQPSLTPSHTPLAATPTSTLPVSPMLIGTLALGEAPVPGHSPESMAVLGQRVYVANRSSDNVSVIEGDRVVAVVPVGRGPSSVASDPATQRVFVLNDSDGSISVLEEAQVVATWAPDEAPSTLAMVADELWVGTQGGAILVLSTTDGARKARTALTGSGAVLALAPHVASGRVYAATYGQVHAVAIRTLDSVASAGLQSYRTVAVSPDGRRLYVGVWDAEVQHQSLLVLAADDLTVLQRLAVPGDTSAALCDPTDGSIYLLDSYLGEVDVIDPVGLRVTERAVAGRAPVAAALGSDGRLYVANRDGDNVVALTTAPLAVVASIPLSLRIDGLSASTQTGLLYAAVGAANSVYTLDANAPVAQWVVNGYPYQVSALPNDGRLAVLGLADGRVHLLDAHGQPVLSADAGRYPDGLTLDFAHNTLYAGQTAIDLTSLTTETLSVTDWYEQEMPARRVVRDTQRDRLYVVVSNGVPGSNGGYVTVRYGAQGAEVDAPAPGRLSVIDLLYDAETDRFLATNARMGSYGLQVSAAEDCRELLYLPLDGYPTQMALNPSTHHLWVALQPGFHPGSSPVARLVVFDTRSLGQVAVISIDDDPASLAVDSATGRVYVGSAERGAIHVVQDVPMPEPPAPTVTLTPTPWPSYTPTSEPTVTATRVAARTPTPTPTCAWGLDPALNGAYAALGGQAKLGCAVGAATAGSWAVQQYDGGLLFWRGDAALIYVLRTDGAYSSYADEWREGMPEASCEAVPPAGRSLPKRGFGLVWCRQAGVAEALGWPTGEERGLSILSQPLVGGMLLLDDRGVAYLLGTDGKWKQTE